MAVDANLVPGVRKLAVLRANAIGDFIFILPALDALRAAYPRAEIVLLGQPWHAAFLRERPGPIDRVIVIPRMKGVREDREHPGVDSPAEFDRFFRAMTCERFDLALQMHGGGRNSNPFVLRLGARITAGMKTPDAPPLDRWIPYIYWQNEILRYLEVASLVGAQVTTVEPRVAVTEKDVDEARRVVPDTDKPLVALHPGAGDPMRRWPVEKFAAVGEALVAAGAQVVVTGAGFEKDLVGGVVHSMRSPAQVLCGALSLSGLAGLLSRCRLVVSNDSGPLHLAGAVGAATVGIYWCGNMMTSSPVFRARHRPVSSWRLHCPVCGQNTLEQNCGHQVSYVAEIPVEEVLDAALDLYRQEAPQWLPSAA